VALEREPQEGDVFPAEVPEFLFELRDRRKILHIVLREDCLQEKRLDPSTPAGRDEGADILGKTGAAEAHAGDEEPWIDSRIEPEPFVHLVVGNAEGVAQICELVRKRHLRCEEPVRNLHDRLLRPYVRREGTAYRRALSSMLPSCRDGVPTQRKTTADGPIASFIVSTTENCFSRRTFRNAASIPFS